jgi:formyl-CoA transferase
MYSIGEPNMPPLLIQFAVIDQATAVMASYEVVLALLMRDRFGIGQEVDVSLLGTTSYLMYFNYLVPLLTGHEVPRHARAAADALRNIYQCQDGKWLILSESAREDNWQTICDLLGLSELADDPRFSNRDTRMDNSSELVVMFNEAFARKPRGEWLRLFAEKDVVMCAVNTIWEAINDPQMVANDYIVDSEHPDMGHIKIPGFPIKLSGARVANTFVAPKLGEHTEIVLTELGGYSAQEIHKFKEDGVV